MSEREIDPQKAVDFIRDHGAKLAYAKATRIYLEEFRKSKKALLMKQSSETAVNAQERDAYSHPEYQQLLNDLRAAVEAEEALKWHMVAAEDRIEVWRSQEASNRAEFRATI
jgi:hypothetical protein